MRLETRTCGAARPAPSYSAMVSSMSSMSRCTSGAPMPSGGTGAATRRSTGCPSRATRRTAMPPCWQTGPPPASRLTARPVGPRASPAVPSLADAAVAAGWAIVALDNARRERYERDARAAYGAVVAGLRRLPAPVRLLYLAATVAAVLLVERRTGRWGGTPLLAAAGVLLVAEGAARPRRALVRRDRRAGPARGGRPRSLRPRPPSDLPRHPPPRRGHRVRAPLARHRLRRARDGGGRGAQDSARGACAAPHPGRGVRPLRRPRAGAPAASPQARQAVISSRQTASSAGLRPPRS